MAGSCVSPNCLIFAKSPSFVCSDPATSHDLMAINTCLCAAICKLQVHTPCFPLQEARHFFLSFLPGKACSGVEEAAVHALSGCRGALCRDSKVSGRSWSKKSQGRVSQKVSSSRVVKLTNASLSELVSDKSEPATAKLASLDLHLPLVIFFYTHDTNKPKARGYRGL